MRRKTVLSIVSAAIMLLSITACGQPQSVVSDSTPKDLPASDISVESVSSSQPAEDTAEYEGLDDEPYIPDVTIEMLDNAPTIEAVNYSGMWEDGMIVLLAKDEEAGVSVYSIDAGGNYILRIGDEIYILEDELGGPQYYGTEFSMTDLDNDGEDEFALIVCRGSGTGFFRKEISVYEKENGQYKRYTPDYSVFVKKVSDWFKEQHPDIDNFGFEDYYSTEIKGDHITVTFSPGFMNEGVAYPEYDPAYDVMADIEYSKDGSFSLTDIRPVDNNLSYEDIIDVARDMLSGKSNKAIIGENITLSLEFGGINRDYQELGYAITDINNDGVDELIFGVNPVAGNPGWKGYVYDIYTTVDGQVIQLADGAARYHWFICKDNMVAYEISSDGFSIGWEYWTVSKNGYMSLKETVINQKILDENGKSKTLWLYSNQLSYEYHNSYELFDVITEEKAQEIKGKYEYIYPEFKPF